MLLTFVKKNNINGMEPINDIYKALQKAIEKAVAER